MTTKHCANGRGCAAFAVLGEPAKLSRYTPETVCSECLLRARRGGAEEEDMRNALRAARKKKPSAKDKAKGKRGAGISATVRGIETPAREAPEADHERGRDVRMDRAEARWFTVSEVAKKLAVSPKTVYGWILDGELAATKFGPQTTRVRASELARFEREGIEG